MTKNKYRWFSLLCVGIISTLLVGCSGDTGGSENSSSTKVEAMPTITVDETKEFPDKYGTVLESSRSYFGDYYLSYDANQNDGRPLFDVGEIKYKEAIARLYQHFEGDTSYEEFAAQLGSDWQKNKDYYNYKAIKSQ